MPFMNRRWPFVNGRIRGWARTHIDEDGIPDTTIEGAREKRFCIRYHLLILNQTRDMGWNIYRQVLGRKKEGHVLKEWN
jgi:hypothetical protein